MSREDVERIKTPSYQHSVQRTRCVCVVLEVGPHFTLSFHSFQGETESCLCSMMLAPSTKTWGRATYFVVLSMLLCGVVRHKAWWR